MPPTTFFGYPSASVSSTTESTIVILGSKCVSKSLHPTFDQKSATRVLRELSQEYDTHNLSINVKLENYDIVDLGDFNCRNLSEVVPKILDNKSRIIIVGGDHTTTYYALKNIRSISKLTILDAHLDSEETYSIHHGSFLYNLLSQITINNLIIAGMRGYSTMDSEYKYLSKIDSVRILPWPVSMETLGYIIKRSKFVSLDLDFLSPTTFPCVRVPESFGIEFDAFIRLINRLKAPNLVYFDVVEYAPRGDKNFVCGKMLIQLLLEILALFVRNLETQHTS